ncbi:YicC/YloC family endoribonuclease [Pseudalkalibacillus hwajinpoensis]|uniref:YicC/YloC family endoribonuclease n=1 Tax=Guptibacillus hwajinpoensis TaxID=208199 RepID=UPI00325BE36B
MSKSMTGYGRASCERNDIQLTIEVKSINHRYFDGSFRMPKALLHLESKMKTAIQRYVNRGKIDVYLTIDGAGFSSSVVKPDWHLLDQYITVLRQAAERYSLKDDVSVASLLSLDDAFCVQKKEIGIEQMEELIFETLDQAVKSLVEMRCNEGKALNRDIQVKLTGMEEEIAAISHLSEQVPIAFEKRIRSRLEGFKELEEVDEGRILAEVAVLADKASIDEEIIRLRSHLTQFHDILTSDGVVGRKLDFLVQEINRELNTIGSKSSHHKISQHVVDLKSEVEKIREQVQNIE